MRNDDRGGTDSARVAPCAWPPHRDEPRCERASLLAENERLRAEVEEWKLRHIEATNPGIDMEEVRRARSTT